MEVIIIALASAGVAAGMAWWARVSAAYARRYSDVARAAAENAKSRERRLRDQAGRAK